MSGSNVLYATVAYNDTVGDNDPTQLSGSLYRSTDGGRNWSEQSGGVQIERVAVDPGAASTLWAVRANHVVERSVNGGQSWQKVTMPSLDASGATPWRDLAIARAGGRPATIVVAASPTRTRRRQRRLRAITRRLRAWWRALPALRRASR